jgi:hypothetical protein
MPMHGGVPIPPAARSGGEDRPLGSAAGPVLIDVQYTNRRAWRHDHPQYGNLQHTVNFTGTHMYSDDDKV